MPSPTILSHDDKVKIKSAIPVSLNKIYTAALARIYFSNLQPIRWSYGGLQGALIFAYDTQKGIFSLKMVDLAGTRGVIWEHALYEGFEYNQDGPLFHSFPGDKCMIGLVFDEEAEAKTFFKKVNNRKAEKASSSTQKKSAKNGKIDKLIKSDPAAAGSFTNADPSWTAFLGQLESQGVDKSMIDQNMDFIKDFVRDAQKPPPKKKKYLPPPALRGGAHAQSDSVSSIQQETAVTTPLPTAPPPAPPPRQVPAPAGPPPAPVHAPAPTQRPLPPPPTRGHVALAPPVHPPSSAPPTAPPPSLAPVRVPAPPTVPLSVGEDFDSWLFVT